MKIIHNTPTETITKTLIKFGVARQWSAQKLCKHFNFLVLPSSRSTKSFSVERRDGFHVCTHIPWDGFHVCTQRRLLFFISLPTQVENRLIPLSHHHQLTILCEKGIFFSISLLFLVRKRRTQNSALLKRTKLIEVTVLSNVNVVHNIDSMTVLTKSRSCHINLLSSLLFHLTCLPISLMLIATYIRK